MLQSLLTRRTFLQIQVRPLSATCEVGPEVEEDARCRLQLASAFHRTRLVVTVTLQQIGLVPLPQISHESRTPLRVLIQQPDRSIEDTRKGQL